MLKVIHIITHLVLGGAQDNTVMDNKSVILRLSVML
jgi:hypothetical protein